MGTQGNVRTPRPYGDGVYGESLYGRWDGAYVIEAPCAPSWGAQAPCTPTWAPAAPCAPAWTAKENC
jgi:hypothetical protein